MKIPKPFSIAIDDLGWMQGKNEGYLGEGPYRVGIKRKMELNDYFPIIDLAKKVGVRLQGLFILGELDRENAIYEYPTLVPPNKKWYHEKEDAQLEIMDYVKVQSAFLEFGLHGVGHEYWPDSESNKFKRAEWYNLEDKTPWPEASLRNHLDCFKNIMSQYGITKSNHHSFPESFVPCAYSYYWNPNPQPEEYSLGNLLQEYGVQYANTDFSKIPESSPPIDGGFDQNVHVINRYNYGNLWHMIGQLPMIPVKYQNTNFIEVHWPNLLAQDTFLQEQVTTDWVNYYEEINSMDDRYCSKNTAQHHSQFLYCKYTSLSKSDNAITIDNSRMPLDDAHKKVAQNLVLKIPIPKDEHLSQITLDGQSIPAYFEFSGYAYLFLPKLDSRKYNLDYTIGKKLPQDLVWHDTTANMLSLQLEQDSFKISGRFYGNQTMQFLTSKTIQSIQSNNPLLNITTWAKNEKGYSIEFSAKDIQGVSAELLLMF